MQEGELGGKYGLSRGDCAYINIQAVRGLYASAKDAILKKAVRFRNSWIEFDTNEDYEAAMKWEETGMLDKFIRL